MGFGDELVYGGECKIVGPAGSDQIALQIAGNAIDIAVPIKHVAKVCPALVFAGGLKASQSVRFTGRTRHFDNGEELTPDTPGTVMAPMGEDKVCVKFAGLDTIAVVEPQSLSKM